MIQTDKTLVEVIEDPLISDRYVDFTNDETAGAISTFIGVTRNNFNNKVVLRLEYEAYVPMAEQKLQQLCDKVPWPVLELCRYKPIENVRYLKRPVEYEAYLRSVEAI
jgi:molybdopterin synthase catalytic subunit